MARSNFLPRPIELAASKGMGGFKGDAEIAEETGITFDPESARSQYESGRQVAALLHDTAALATMASTAPKTEIHENQKGGPDASSYGHLTPEEHERNARGIDEIRKQLGNDTERDQ